GGEGPAISQASSPTRTGYYAGVPTAANWPRNPEQVSIGSWVLFLAKDCWMRRQHAIRVVFRLGGHETGPYLGTVVGLPFSRGDHHRVGSVPFATDGSHLGEEVPVVGQQRRKCSLVARIHAAVKRQSERLLLA